MLVLALLAIFLPLEELLAAFGRVPLWVWPTALPAFLTLHLLGAAKWRLLVNAGGAGLSFPGALRCHYAGLFGNTLLPSVVGGDVVRAGLAIREGESGTGVVLGSVVDRGMDVLAIAALVGAGALLAPRALEPASRQLFLTVAVLLAGAALAAALVVRFTPVRWLPYRALRLLARLRRTARLAARRPERAAVALALGVLLQVSLTLLNAGLGRAVGLEAPFHVWLFVWPMAKLAALLPFTQGGIGVREAALAALFAPFGVSAVLAVAAGLAFQGVVIGGGLVGGGLSMWLGRRSRSPAGLRAFTDLPPSSRPDRPDGCTRSR